MKYSVDPLNGFLHSLSGDGSDSDEESASGSSSSGEAESSEGSEEDAEQSSSKKTQKRPPDHGRSSNKNKGTGGSRDNTDESLSGYTISVPLSSQKRVSEENPDHHTSEEDIEYSETHSDMLNKRDHPHHPRHHRPVLNPNKLVVSKVPKPRKIPQQKPL